MRYVIIGAGGHSKEVADLVIGCGYEIAGFADASKTGFHVSTGLPIVADIVSIEFDMVTIAVGEPAARRRLFDEVSAGMTESLEHPSACVSPHATVERGCQVMQNAVVSADAHVGANCILNVGCFVAHDCRVGAHCHIAPGALLSGGSAVGEASVIGAGAVLLPGVRVGRECTVGAGAVVTSDVADGATVAGVPARVTSGGSDAR